MTTNFDAMKSTILISLVACGVLLAGCDTTRSAMKSEPDRFADRPPIDRTQRPPAGPLPEASFPEYETLTLENGLTLYLIPSQRQPTITYRLMLRSGGLYDGDKPGLAEMVADLLTKGVEGKSAFDIANETDFIGGRIGAESTSDFTAVTVSGLSKYSGQLLRTLTELALRPTFPEEELAKLRQRYLSSLRSQRQNPGEMADLLRRKLVYGENGYGFIKTEESVAAIAREDLVAFHEAHFAANNASLAIVGDFDRKALLKEIDATLAKWEPRELEPLPEMVFPEISGVSIHVVDRPGSVQSTIRVAQQSVARADPDALELRVVMSILGGGGSGRMFRNLREDKGYTYGAFSYAANAARFGAIVTSVEVRNEVTEDAVRQILLELERIGEIEESELSLHKRYLTGNYILSLESAGATASRVQEIDIYGLEPSFYRDYVGRLANMTSESAEALALRRVESENLVVAIVGDAASIAPALEQFGPVTVYDDRFEVAR